MGRKMSMHLGSYVIGESEDKASKVNTHVALHTHEGYEIMLFLEADAKFVVEDRVYPVEPYDMIIIRQNELHCFYRHVPAPYRRVILGVDKLFFQENNCPEYEKIFLNTEKNVDNKIPAKVVKSSGLLDAFMRYQKYSKDYTLSQETPVLKSIIIEILYLMNNCSEFAESDHVKGSMKSVIIYINDHYWKDITLDDLCNRFYLSKPYLCKAFQKSTGLTINGYIRKKRLGKVKELKAQGMSISDAAVKAGFRNYTAFYRAYKNEYGKSPKKDLG